ncbi:hypothetical protein scyTo_0017267 [Scyliorhinus torazame]|uniref:Uncharacterized protein n=1 Tax=Scyliorhinus torazame TaxID=75743 RepID=A0A401Q5I1_SCYTO|nr:hypothetical protein [Scyliorhinus torazame]
MTLSPDDFTVMLTVKTVPRPPLCDADCKNIVARPLLCDADCKNTYKTTSLTLTTMTLSSDDFTVTLTVKTVPRPLLCDADWLHKWNCTVQNRKKQPYHLLANVL